jgi:hypothetical protein
MSSYSNVDECIIAAGDKTSLMIQCLIDVRFNDTSTDVRNPNISSYLAWFSDKENKSVKDGLNSFWLIFAVSFVDNPIVFISTVTER